jgi:RNA polymerase sigma-70 factor (ECF subfamily)
MDRESELELVACLRRGDPAAFDAVHGAFNARVFSFLVRLSRRRDVAEDLLEETWLRLVQHSRRLNADTRLGPWLFTVSRNLYVSYCRSRALDGAAVGIGLWPTPPAPPSPFEATAASLLERRLEAALASLPALSREVLLLVGAEGMTPSEAAAVCGVTPETMRQRLSRARSQLAARLDGATARDVPLLKEAAS